MGAEECKAMLAAIKEYQKSESVATAELWNPTTNTWSALPPLGCPAAGSMRSLIP